MLDTRRNNVGHGHIRDATVGTVQSMNNRLPKTESNDNEVRFPEALDEVLKISWLSLKE